MAHDYAPPKYAQVVAEIKRRIDDLNSGKAKAIPWEKARRMIFGDEDESDAD